MTARKIEKVRGGGLEGRSQSQSAKMPKWVDSPFRAKMLAQAGQCPKEERPTLYDAFGGRQACHHIQYEIDRNVSLYQPPSDFRITPEIVAAGVAMLSPWPWPECLDRGLPEKVDEVFLVYLAMWMMDQHQQEPEPSLWSSL